MSGFITRVRRGKKFGCASDISNYYTEITSNSCLKCVVKHEIFFVISDLLALIRIGQILTSFTVKLSNQLLKIANSFIFSYARGNNSTSNFPWKLSDSSNIVGIKKVILYKFRWLRKYHFKEKFLQVLALPTSHHKFPIKPIKVSYSVYLTWVTYFAAHLQIW